MDKKILKLRPETIKLRRKKKQRKNLFPNCIDNYFLNMTLKTQATKAKKKISKQYSVQFSSVQLLSCV